MPFLSRAQASIYYEILAEAETEADGPWITLLNGHTRSSRDFRFMSKTFAGKGYRCLSLDNRSSGQSSHQGPLRLQDMVDDVLALWNELRIDLTHLFGISMGGMLSQIIAAQHPQRLKSLILVSSAASDQQLQSLDFEPWGDRLETVEARLKKYVTPAFYAGNKLLIQAMAKQTLQAILNDNFSARADEQHKAIRGLDNRPLLAKIQAPTLILHGTADTVIKVAAAEELAAGIPHSTLHLVEGVGHLLLAEYSKGLSEEVLSWCRQHP